MGRRQNGLRERFNFSFKKPANHVTQVTKDQSEWGFTVKQGTGATTIHHPRKQCCLYGQSQPPA